MKLEFSQILSEVKELFIAKTRLLQLDVNFTIQIEGKLNLVDARIKDLEASAVDINENYSNNQDMYINFKRRANEILKEIEELNC